MLDAQAVLVCMMECEFERVRVGELHDLGGRDCLLDRADVLAAALPASFGVPVLDGRAASDGALRQLIAVAGGREVPDASCRDALECAADDAALLFREMCSASLPSPFGTESLAAS